MARQSLKANPIDDAIQYLKETAAATGDEYRRMEEHSDRLRDEYEALQNTLAQLRADHDRIQGALERLEAQPTAGNGQDIPDVTPPSPPNLVELPTDDWVLEEVSTEVIGGPEEPHTEEHEPPPPPEAA